MTTAHIFYIPLILAVGMLAGFFLGQNAAEERLKKAAKKQKRRQALREKKRQAAAESD